MCSQTTEGFFDIVQRTTAAETDLGGPHVTGSEVYKWGGSEDEETYDNPGDPGTCLATRGQTATVGLRTEFAFSVLSGVVSEKLIVLAWAVRKWSVRSDR